MSESEEVPPTKLCELNLSAMALVYKDNTKTLDQIVQEPEVAATVTDDDADEMIVPEDENEGYNSRLEMITDCL